MLYRYLLAARQSAAKAHGLVAATLAWRESAGVDALVRGFDFAERAAFLEAYPQGWHKCDRAGRPVFIQQLGRADVDRTLAVTTEERMVALHLQEYEKLLGVILPACNVLRGGPPRADGARPPAVRGSTCLVDMRGVGLASMVRCKKVLTMFMALDGAHFPETMDCVIFIGAPAWFNGVLAAFRALMSPALAARVEVVAGDFRARLRELVGEENLLVG